MSFSVLIMLFVIAIIGLLEIAVRFVVDYDKMRNRARTAVKELVDELARVKKCLPGCPDLIDPVAPAGDDLLALVARMETKAARLSKRVAQLVDEHKNLSLFNRTNTGTGEWLKIAQEAETACTSLRNYVSAYRLEEELRRYDQPANME